MIEIINTSTPEPIGVTHGLRTPHSQYTTPWVLKRVTKHKIFIENTITSD